jgi:hypothetical protein
MGRWAIKPLDVRATRYWAHEMRTHLKSVGAALVVVCYKEADLSDEPSYYTVGHRGWQASMVLGLYACRWEAESFYRDAKQRFGLGDC